MIGLALLCGNVVPRAMASDAPGWMHALVNAPLPAHDEKTDAVLLYSEQILTVQPNGKIKSLERMAYKILRPGGKGFGTVRSDFDAETKITSIHGWCIPASGKDYEVKEKDAIETSLFGVANGELVSDVRTKLLQIPAADPGNIVGYEVEQEGRPYVLQDFWLPQDTIPVREASYTLQLPVGWEYKAVWLNHEEVKPVSLGNNHWQWVVSDMTAIKAEDAMPPRQSVAAQMIVSLFPAGGGENKGFTSWQEMANWQRVLYQGRREASPEIKKKVAQLTAAAATPLARMQALAGFLQQEIRYVAITLGIGGLQPHPAPEIFTHRYGDCKDKATLLSTMLREVGIDSYYVVINTERGGASPAAPPALNWFNHVILAIRLPDGVNDPSLVAVFQNPKLGRLLIFDPTDEMTPFGHLRGPLQANYGLLVTADGGELIELPKLDAAMNGVRRTAKLTLSPNGILSGDVREERIGDAAADQRYELRAATKDADRIKPIETTLAHSLGTFRITNAAVGNVQQKDRPFVYDYSLVAENYAKSAGILLLVRPRVLGVESNGFLETKEPRKFSVEFEGPSRDTDTFEITLPVGYEVDDLPNPVNAEYSFASYHSKTEVSGNVLRYTRTFEVKELSVPVSKVDELKKLYRIIAGDERSTAVLKPTTH
jgi:hypothetical protein